MTPNQPNQYPPAPSPFDSHVIETPEQTPLKFAVAGVGSRFLAIAIDTIIQAVTLLFLVLVLAVVSAGSGLFKSNWPLAVTVGLIFLLNFGYFAIFEIAWSGQTPGKRMTGLRVVKDSGRPLTAPETIGRNLMRIVDQLPVVYAVGLIVCMTNPQNKRLGDFVAGSIVIRESLLEGIAPMLHSDVPAAIAALASSDISMKDLTLIDTFLNRRSHLPEHIRSRMANDIYARIKPKLTFTGEVHATAEAILEFVAYQRRSRGA